MTKKDCVVATCFVELSFGKTENMSTVSNIFVHLSVKINIFCLQIIMSNK